MAVLNQKSVLDLIKEFRRNWHVLGILERTTLCGADSMLLALQLSMAENNKRHNEEFTVSLSDVLMTWKYLLREKLNLPVENMEVVDHYEDIKKTYDDFLKNSNMLDLIDVYKKCKILPSSCENEDIISPIQLWEFLSGKEYAVDDVTDVGLPISPLKHNQDNEKFKPLLLDMVTVLMWTASPESLFKTHLHIQEQKPSLPCYLTIMTGAAVQLQPEVKRNSIARTPRWFSLMFAQHHRTNTICMKDLMPLRRSPRFYLVPEWTVALFEVQLTAKKIIFSYLNLLVNSKNDLALAHILNIPDRGLGREAFTDLKHAAREKQMSIFLVATSFIRAIQLGGKGYAPSPSDPLRTHVKGLSNFINFIDRLDEILGEIPNPSIAGSRILSVIKMQLVKGQDSGNPFYKAIEEVVQDLDLRIKNILNSQQEGVPVSTTDISPARPKSFAINHDTAYCGRDTVKTLLVLLDEETASAPTRNKAELLYSDENTIHHTGTSILTLFTSPTQATNSSMKPLIERIHASMQEKKAKMKQTLIRSQFACTYKDDCMMSKDKWRNINSTSQPLGVLHMENGLPEGVNSSAGMSTIGTSSGNVHLGRSKNVSRKPSNQTGNESSKRKQVDLDGENVLFENGNEAPQCENVKRPKTSNSSWNKSDGKLARIAKGSKSHPKDKLITGQTKLTQFFRL